MSKVFVTGANGLLGTNLVLTLLEQGFEVIALVRKKNSFIKPHLKNLTIIEGNLFNPIKLDKGIGQCQFVVHIAANTSQNLLKLKDYYKVNVEGTKNIIDTCIRNNVQKMVYIGTANTYGFGSLSDLGDENKEMKYPFTKSLYAISKKLAQDIIDEASKKLNITTISPTFMIGPYDTKPSSGKLILSVLNKRFGLYPSGGKNFIHVQDVVKSIILSFDLKKTGQKFILANENITYRDFFNKVIKLNKQKTTLIAVPDFILKGVGILGNLLRGLNIKTEISLANTTILTVDNYYSNRQVKENMRIKFISVDKAIIDFLEYYNNANLRI